VLHPSYRPRSTLNQLSQMDRPKLHSPISWNEAYFACQPKDAHHNLIRKNRTCRLMCRLTCPIYSSEKLGQHIHWTRTGTSRATAFPGENIFAGPFRWKNVWILLFKMVHSGVVYISKRWQGPKTLQGSGKTSPSPLATGLDEKNGCEHRM